MNANNSCRRIKVFTYASAFEISVAPFVFVQRHPRRQSCFLVVLRSWRAEALRCIRDFVSSPSQSTFPGGLRRALDLALPHSQYAQS